MPAKKKPKRWCCRCTRNRVQQTLIRSHRICKCLRRGKMQPIEIYHIFGSVSHFPFASVIKTNNVCLYFSLFSRSLSLCCHSYVCLGKNDWIGQPESGKSLFISFNQCCRCCRFLLLLFIFHLFHRLLNHFFFHFKQHLVDYSLDFIVWLDGYCVFV